MRNVTRKKEVAVAAAMAILTTAAVAAIKVVGSDIAAALIAGAGATVTVAYVVVTNIMIKQADRK